MKNLLLLILVGIILAGIYLSTGGNISSSEMVLNESKARDAVAKINNALDTVGEGAFYNLEVEVADFKGVVDQPASSFESHLVDYKVTDSVELEFSTNETIKLKAGGGTPLGIINNSLPKDVKDSNKSEKVEGVTIVEAAGVKPIMRDKTAAVEWTEDFLFSPQGVNIEELPGNWTSLKGSGAVNARIAFLNFIFGDATTLEWDEYKVDRLVAMKEVNIDSLTGVEKNKDVVKLIDPNRVSLFEVNYVNTNNFRNLDETAISTVKGTLEDSEFIFNLANHLNQVIGGKTLIIPHKDTFKVTVSNDPLFKLD